MYCPARSRARLLTPGDSRWFTAIHGTGMTLGEPGYFAVERNRIMDIIAVEPTTVIRLDRCYLAPFMERYSSIKDRALEALASGSRWQTTRISSAARRPLTDRLILKLLELVDSSPSAVAGHVATPKISQSTLAAMIGVTRENVNRALSALAIDGVIRQEGGRYVFVDEDRARREISRDWPLPRSETDAWSSEPSVSLDHAPGVIQRHSALPISPSYSRERQRGGGKCPRRRPTSTSASFASMFSGTVIGPDDPGYDAARAVWNGSIDARLRSSLGARRRRTSSAP